jgi:hypothetical protein
MKKFGKNLYEKIIIVVLLTSKMILYSDSKSPLIKKLEKSDSNTESVLLSGLYCLSPIYPVESYSQMVVSCAFCNLQKHNHNNIQHLKKKH